MAEWWRRECGQGTGRLAVSDVGREPGNARPRHLSDGMCRCTCAQASNKTLKVLPLPLPCAVQWHFKSGARPWSPCQGCRRGRPHLLPLPPPFPPHRLADERLASAWGPKQQQPLGRGTHPLQHGGGAQVVAAAMAPATAQAGWFIAINSSCVQQTATTARLPPQAKARLLHSGLPLTSTPPNPSSAPAQVRLSPPSDTHARTNPQAPSLALKSCGLSIGHTTISCTSRLAWSWPAMSSQVMVLLRSRTSLNTGGGREGGGSGWRGGEGRRTGQQCRWA